MPDGDSRNLPPLAERVYTAKDVALIVGWFGGNESRWRDHVRDDAHEIVNVGRGCTCSKPTREPSS